MDAGLLFFIENSDTPKGNIVISETSAEAAHQAKRRKKLAPSPSPSPTMSPTDSVNTVQSSPEPLPVQERSLIRR